MKSSVVKRSSVSVELEHPSALKRIGLIVLSTDHTLERDFQRICSPETVGLFATRVAFENPTTPDSLRRLLPQLQDAAAMILPGSAMDAMCFGCTAATVIIGDEPIQTAIQEAKPGTPVVTPSGAAALGLEAVGARRISILTPYNLETSTPFADYFSSRGFDVVSLECLGLDDDRDIARVSKATIVRAARNAAAPDADAIFLSCTALRAVECIAGIEQALELPAVSSNQASIWLSLRRAGITDPVDGFGHLFTLPGPN